MADWYKHNICDFDKRTKLLTMTERGAYRALLDAYYMDERPLPTDPERLCRAAGAISEVERAAVAMVIATFFTESESGYVHDRVEAELAKIGPKRARNREVALRREAERAAERARNNSKVGAGEVLATVDVDQIETTNRAQNVPRTEHEHDHQNSTTRANIETLRLEPSGANAPHVPDCPQQALLDAYHEILPMCPRQRVWTSSRQAQLRARWRQAAQPGRVGSNRGYQTEAEGVAWWRRFFEWLAKSRFLTGQVDPPPGRPRFVATLEWITKQENFAKIIEGKYDEPKS